MKHLELASLIKVSILYRRNWDLPGWIVAFRRILGINRQWNKVAQGRKSCLTRSGSTRLKTHISKRLDHMKAIIQQIWILSLANAKKVGKEVDLMWRRAQLWLAWSQSKRLLGCTLELPAWCGDVTAQQPPRSRRSKCVATFLGLFFFISFQEMGWRQPFLPEHA